MTGCTETLCTKCAHLHVCSLKEEFLNAQSAVNQVNVSRGDHTFIRLSLINWIKPVELECIHFLRLKNEKCVYNLCTDSTSTGSEYMGLTKTNALDF